MSANVETMFSVRVKPWHGIGTIVEECLNSIEAIQLAGLDWSYFSHPCQSSGNHAPKCLHFSILCASIVAIHAECS